MTIIYRIHTFL